MGGVYVARTPTTGVLDGVVRAHLAQFIATLDARTDGVGLPPFNLHVHFHTLVLDGVFVAAADGTLQFCPAAAPTDAEVA